MKNHAGWGSLIGAIMGLGIVAFRGEAAVWHGNTSTASCGLDKGFALIGLAMTVVTIGSVLGTVIGFFIKTE